jgi:hypothetical protein
MNQQRPHHSPSPTTVATSSTLKRTRTSILRSDGPVFLVEGSYWPRVLLSDSAVDTRRTVKRRRSSGCDDGINNSTNNRQRSPSATKAIKRGVKNTMKASTPRHTSHNNLRRLHKTLLRHVLFKYSISRCSKMKTANRNAGVNCMNNFPPPDHHLYNSYQFRWQPDSALTLAKNNKDTKTSSSCCSSITGKAWPCSTSSLSSGSKGSNNNLSWNKNMGTTQTC